MAATPVTILAGFLGAGKTTLINHILRSAGGRRLAVLVNDFGDINIDADLIVGVEGGVLSLAGGCICCSMQAGLVKTLLDVVGREPAPDHIVIETSGVSIPQAVAETLRQPELGGCVALDAVLGITDACLFPDLTGDERELALDQLAAADVVVINKIDLVDQARLGKVHALVGEVSPHARLIETTHGAVPVELALGVDAECGGGRQPRPGSAKREPRRRSAHPQFQSHSWRSDRPVSLQKVRETIEWLPPTILRGKGILFLAEHPDVRAIWHLVGRRSTLTAGAPWRDAPENRIVLIGSADCEAIAASAAAFESCLVDPSGTH